MRQTYRENIIVAALMYNYIANNKSDTLLVQNINEYIEVINKYLQMNGVFDIDLSGHTVSSSSMFFFPIEDFRRRKSVIMNISLDLEKYYNHYIKYLPQVLLTATLQEEALNKIKVCKDDLPIFGNYPIKFIIKDIYADSEDDAKRLAIASLEKSGKDGIITNVTSDVTNGIKCYHVHLRYTDVIEYLDEDLFKEMQKQKVNRHNRRIGW